MKSEAKKSVLAKSVNMARNEPRWFVDKVLNQLEETDEWQIETLEAIADIRRKRLGIPTRYNHEGLQRITIRSCHGTGKTHVLALILHWWNFCFYGLVVGTAPKQDQIKTRFMPRYRKIRMGAKDEYQAMQVVDTLKVTILKDPDWGYIGETASTPENLAGYHDTPQLFLVDEGSAKVLDPLFPVIEGALSTPGSVVVTIGNPTRTSGEFHASHNKRGVKELYYRMHVRPDMSRYVDKKWQDTMKKKYGEKSSVFQIRCLGNFVDQEENQLLALSWVEDAKHEWQEDGSQYKLRITVDVADGGEDDSVVTVCRLYESFTLLYRMYRFSFLPSVASIKTAQEAIRIAEEHEYNMMRGDDIVVDSIGVGAGTAGTIMLDGRFRVIQFVGGSTQGVNTNKFRNQRSRCYIAIRDDFRDGSIIIDPEFCSEDDWEEYLAQACSVKTKPGGERIEEIVPKKEVKDNGGKSPDMTDGTMMVKANQTPVIGKKSTNKQSSIAAPGQMESANADW